MMRLRSWWKIDEERARRGGWRERPNQQNFDSVIQPPPPRQKESKRDITTYTIMDCRLYAGFATMVRVRHGVQDNGTSHSNGYCARHRMLLIYKCQM